MLQQYNICALVDIYIYSLYVHLIYTKTLVLDPIGKVICHLPVYDIIDLGS
jgi:hypothetical protein